MIVEIAESCGDCYFGARYHETYPLRCYVTGKEFGPYKEDRLENCPLVGLYKKYSLEFKEKE